jgi:hypothetical protein
MNFKPSALAIALGLIAGTAHAGEGPTPSGIPHLEHVFVIVMENHGYSQLLNNPNAPFINQFAHSANLATNYYAVAHPSLTNYLEIVGGSNFGVLSDNYPDWHNAGCLPNIVAGTANTDTPPSPAICPIAGAGTDAATPAIDTSNETQGTPGEVNIDGTQSYAAASGTLGITIGDQLARAGMSWKSYQESLPMQGPDRVNFSDGYFTDSTDFSKINPQLNPPLSKSDVVALYAAKHNPFVYFKSVQDGTMANNSFKNVVGFDGPEGLYADLARGHLPHLVFIAPNQCNDQHGRGNAGAFCNYDPSDDGTQAGLNPALIQRGDVTVQQMVGAIHASPAWKHQRSAIVLVWDENDYSLAPNTNQVMTVVQTNYGRHGVVSNKRYTHFSLLKSMEAAFGLPCLNHACDASTAVMADLFADH